MSECPDQSDFCPHCQRGVEISSLEFGLRITAKLLTCPNCGIVAAVRVPSAKSKSHSLVRSMPNLVWMWRKSTMIETLNARFRHLVVFLIIAVFVAAVLRHLLHVYGSISREEIRTGSLLALFFSVSLYLTLLAIKRRR